MIFSNFLAPIATASLILNAGVCYAHGVITDITVGEKKYSGSSLLSFSFWPRENGILWPSYIFANGPVLDVNSKDIVCNHLTGKAKKTAEIKAGDKITFRWYWPFANHLGPVMTYLASCGDNPCSEIDDPSQLSWFKIDEDGYSDGKWASQKLRENGGTWTLTVPEDIAPGYYLMRHEILALHLAASPKRAEFYPHCINLKITGEGSAVPEGVKFPGAYKSTDEGVLINIKTMASPENYVIPGPPVYKPNSAFSENQHENENEHENNNYNGESQNSSYIVPDISFYSYENKQA